MATTGIRFDDGSSGFASNCFPVRGFTNRIDEASGAWLVAQKAEQRRRFKAVLCAKPRDFESIREERIRAERNGTQMVPPPLYDDVEEYVEDDEQKTLDGFFLMKHCCVDDPSDLCSMNINGQGFTDVKVEDLALFDNVAYINAAENYLPFESFTNFPILRELEIPLNAIRGIRVDINDFATLEMLDLSFNNLNADDLLALGLLPNLTVLHLTGNNLRSIPADMGRPLDTDPTAFGSKKVIRYPKLEILLLDDNKLSELATFASLAALPALRHLNLSQNEIYSVPQLLLVEGQHIEDPSRMSRTASHKSRSRLSRQSTNSTRSKHKSKGELGRIDSLMAQREANQQATPLSSEREMMENSEAAKLAAEAIQMAMRSLENSKPNTPQVGGRPPPPTERKSEEKIPEKRTSEKDGIPGKENEKPGSPEKELDEPFAELNLDDIDAKVENQMRQESLEKALRDKEDGTGPPPPPPFPKLHFLNVAHNLIEEEEDLLAVAAWPHLTELVIHDNPLTTLHSGEPPLLRRFLHNRLGIHLQRKKPPPFEKPHIEIIQRKDRVIKLNIPPVPRCDVDALLALEAPPSPISSQHSLGRVLTPQAVLPPIPQTDIDDDNLEDEEEVVIDEPRQGDAFFMTETEEPCTSTRSSMVPTPPSGAPPKQQRKINKKPYFKTKDQFYGYEDLLELSENEAEVDVPPKSDMQSNVTALRHILQHPIVFRDNEVALHKVQKPFAAHVKKGVIPPELPKKTNAHKIAEVMKATQDRSPLIDLPLQKVLKTRKTSAKSRAKAKAEQAQAVQLLNNVQKRYSSVKEAGANKMNIKSNPPTADPSTIRLGKAVKSPMASRPATSTRTTPVSS